MHIHHYLYHLYLPKNIKSLLHDILLITTQDHALLASIIIFIKACNYISLTGLSLLFPGRSYCCQKDWSATRYQGAHWQEGEGIDTHTHWNLNYQVLYCYCTTGQIKQVENKCCLFEKIVVCPLWLIYGLYHCFN